jgi:DNA-binding transcriptional LysR family regulator
MEWSERIGRRIRLRDLHILLAVVQCKSLAAAAEHLAISRPVVSKSIADLEHVLGVRLLERDRHGAEPTIYGAALLKRGTTAFDELREGVKDIEFLTDPAAGEVRIGSNPFLLASFVSAVVDRLSRRCPRIVYHLVVAQPEPDVLLRDLSERNVDLLILRRFGPIADERLDFEFLFEDSYVVAAGAQCPWARRRRIELAELANEQWVLPPPASAFGSVVKEAFRASGLDYPRTTVVTFSPEARIRLLATGRFLAIFPASGLRLPTRHPEIKILPIELPTARVPIGIVTLKNRTLGPVARLFIEHARDVAKPLAKVKAKTGSDRSAF